MTAVVPTVAVLVGSIRPSSNTAKATAVLADELAVLGVRTDVIDPRDLDLRLPGSEGSDEIVSQVTADLRARVVAAAGVVLVTPEYDGSYSAVLKLLLEYLGYPSVLAGKPVALLGLASGQIGATRALEHLRAVCLHVGALALPGAHSVAAVHKVFDAAGQVKDAAMEQGIRAVARELVGFVQKVGPA